MSYYDQPDGDLGYGGGVPVIPGVHTPGVPWAPGFDPGDMDQWNQDNPDQQIGFQQPEGGVAPGKKWDAYLGTAVDAPVNESHEGNDSGGGGGGGGSDRSGPDFSGLDRLITMMMERQAAKDAEDRAFRQSIRGSLLDRIQKASTTPTFDDPMLAARRNVYRGEGERALRLGRENLAARAAQQGLPTGAVDAAIQTSYEDLGQNVGSYSANILAEEYTARRQELMQALTLGAGIMSGDEQRALQSQIAAIDAELGKLRIDTQDTQFYDRLGFDIGNQESMLNYMMWRDMMGV